MLNKIKSKYEKYSGRLSTISFLCGSIWDTLTLRRIDNTRDLIFYSVFLFLSAVIVVLISSRIKFKFSEYLPIAVQFLFGGLFSACTVYYFKSASSVASFAFIIGLATLLVGNEFFEKKYGNSQIVFILWATCAVMVMNYLIPILLHAMGPFIFVLGILCSFLLCSALQYMSASPKPSLKPVALIYIGLTLLYFLNVIPPVPLSKKQMNIYRSVHSDDDNYICAMEKPRWYQPFKKGESTFHYWPGDTLFCFCSIFAPNHLQNKIYHHWYYKDPEKHKYMEIAKIGYQLSGGRDDGYRGYTFKCNAIPGRWKVVLKTPEGKTVGETSFKVVAGNKPVDSENLSYIKY